MTQAPQSPGEMTAEEARKHLAHIDNGFDVDQFLVTCSTCSGRGTITVHSDQGPEQDCCDACGGCGSYADENLIQEWRVNQLAAFLSTRDAARDAEVIERCALRIENEDPQLADHIRALSTDQQKADGPIISHAEADNLGLVPGRDYDDGTW